jgi:hypothetical protein
MATRILLSYVSKLLGIISMPPLLVKERAIEKAPFHASDEKGLL